MRKLKMLLDRRSLETIYFSFIHPILEYADVIWNNCTTFNKDQLERVQNECARIVSGASRLVSLDNLKREIHWKSLEDRRKDHRLILFYKMKNALIPEYLQQLFPPSTGSSTNYNLRNPEYLRPVFSRTSLYYNSFLPATIRDWNNLSLEARNAPSLNIFKNILNREATNTPTFFYVGNRRAQVLHARLRMKCSSLNYYLFLCNIVDSPLCRCGEIENNHHFLLECRYFTNYRTTLMTSLSRITRNISEATLLFGDYSLSDPENNDIFEVVQKYIIDTGRFS